MGFVCVIIACGRVFKKSPYLLRCILECLQIKWYEGGIDFKIIWGWEESWGRDETSHHTLIIVEA